MFIFIHFYLVVIPNYVNIIYPTGAAVSVSKLQPTKVRSSVCELFMRQLENGMKTLQDVTRHIHFQINIDLCWQLMCSICSSGFGRLLHFWVHHFEI